MNKKNEPKLGSVEWQKQVIKDEYVKDKYKQKDKIKFKYNKQLTRMLLSK